RPGVGRPGLCDTWERYPEPPSTSDEARWTAWGCSAAPASRPASTSGVSCRVHACRSNASATAWSTSAIWAFCPGQRVRRSCSCQYIRGNSNSPAHWLQLGGMAICVKSWCTVCHQQSTRVAMPASCLRTLFKVSFFTGSPLVSSNVSIASSPAPNCSSNLLGRLAGCVRQPPGMQNARHIGEVLPPGTAHPLPVRHRGGAGGDLGLSLYNLGRLCLG